MTPLSNRAGQLVARLERERAFERIAADLGIGREEVVRAVIGELTARLIEPDNAKEFTAELFARHSA
jgi:hypothetical protein